MYGIQMYKNLRKKQCKKCNQNKMKNKMIKRKNNLKEFHYARIAVKNFDHII